MFKLITPISYWILTSLWLVILILYLWKLRHSKAAGGAVAVLLTILAIDAFRTVFESVYFGLYFNSLFGLLPKGIYDVLSQPALIVIPKLINVIAGVLVLVLLIHRWVPREIQEREVLVENVNESNRLLKESEERFRNFAESSSDYFWEMDADLKFSYFSEQFEKTSGMPQAALLGKTREETGIPDVAPDVWAKHLVDLKTHRKIEGFEHSRTKPNGQIVWLSISGKPVFDDSGVFQGYRGTGADISQRKQTEDAKQQTENLFRSFIDNSPTFIAVKDLEGRFQINNRTHAQLFGHMSEDIIGKTSFDIHPRSAAEKIVAQDREVIETLSEISEEREAVTTAGLRDYIISKFPVFDGAGVVIGTGTIGTDITERKLAELELRQRTHDLGERIKERTGLYALSEILSRTNISIEKALEEAVHILPPAWHYPGMTCARITYLDHEFTTDNFEETTWRQAAEILSHEEVCGLIEVFYTNEMPELDEGPFVIEERHLINSLATNIGNFLDRKQSEKLSNQAKDDAEKANRAKTEFLASMSHELRTPMNAVLGFAQMLQFDPKNQLTEKQNEYVESILSGGNHLLELINEVLDLAKVEADQLPLFIEEVDAHTIIADCIEMTIPLGQPRNIIIDNQVRNGSKNLLRTDPMRLKQALLNLLSNAVKFNKDGGTVTVESEQTEGDFCRISVKDTGIGISKKDYSGIFQMFRRLGANPEIAREGTGIGLTVTKLLVERMAGRVGFESEEGVGSIFWIELPLASNKEVLIWTEAMRVGIDAIDKDHRVLVELLNKVSQKGHSNMEINKAIDELIDYTIYHFQREEVIMAVCDHPNIQNHHADHRNIVIQARELTSAWQTHHDAETLQYFCRFLRLRLFSHLAKEASEMAKCVAGKGAAIKEALEHLK